MTGYYDFNNVNAIDIEITTFCNAFCGACDRNINGGEVHPSLKLMHMTGDTWNSLITDKNLTHIKKITLDGNSGDASMHPRLIQMLNKLADIKPDLYVKISSNGGARNTKFWKDLALTLNRFSTHELLFAIDGLEDTNHIYRRGVKWDNLIKNVEAFNQSNGISVWRTIVFDHNKHQLLEMEDLAKNMGFYSFRTQRNRVSPMVLNEYKNLPSGTITSPTRDQFEKDFKYIKRFSLFQIDFNVIEYLDPGKYHCPFATEKLISMGVDGKMWPCCHIYGNSLTHWKKFPWKEWDTLNDINCNTLEEILFLFRKNLYSAWENNNYDICNTCMSKSNKAYEYK